MIWAIILLAFILRLINLNQSLWLDESINVLAARDLGFWHFVTGYSIGDFHPPLYFALLWIWSHLFGYSEISVRFPSVLLGVGTVYLTYLIGKDFFSKKVGVIGALLLAMGPLHIYYSQEARMYSLACFAVALSFYGFVKLLEGKKKYWPLYVIGVILTLYSDYLPYLAILSQATYLIIFRKDRFKAIFSGLVVGALTLTPWVFIFPEQLKNGQQTAINVPGWAKVVGGSNAKNISLVFVKSLLGRISFDNPFVYAVVGAPIGLLYLFLFLRANTSELAPGMKPREELSVSADTPLALLRGSSYFRVFKKIDKKIWLFIFWVFFPVILASLISIFIPVLSYFRLLFILPGVYLLAALGVDSLKPKISKAFLVVMVVYSLFCIGLYYTNPAFQREDWQGLTTFLERNSSDKSLVFFENDNFPSPYRYYQKPINATGALNKFPANALDNVKSLPAGNIDKIFLVDYLVEISDPNRLVDKKLIQSGWSVKNVYNFHGVGLVYEYAK